MISLCH